VRGWVLGCLIGAAAGWWARGWTEDGALRVEHERAVDAAEQAWWPR
jgi:hypothetical protein